MKGGNVFCRQKAFRRWALSDRDLITMKLVAKDNLAASLTGEIGPGVDVRLFVLIAHDALRIAEQKGVTTQELREAKVSLARHLAEWGLDSPQIHLPSNGTGLVTP